MAVASMRRRQRSLGGPTPETTQTHRRSARQWGWVEFAAIVLIAIFIARVASTYGVITNVVDSPWHIAAGLDYLRTGEYNYEPQHPPLARVVVAALPFWLEDLTLGKFSSVWANDWANKPLDFYWRTLALARAGNLLFAIPLLLCIFVWGRTLFGPAAGLVGLLAASNSPTLLAHSGLATLDIGVAGTVVIASYCAWRWSREGSRRWCLFTAFATAAAFLTKFSTLAFLPPILIAYFALRPANRESSEAAERWKQWLILTATIGLICWAIYGFSFGPFPRQDPYETERAEAIADNLRQLSLPAPRLWQGLVDVGEHNEKGHMAFLLGEKSVTGWWYYFPIALALKTSPALLVLSLMGLFVLWRNREQFRNSGVVALGVPIVLILAVATLGNINIGIRHILPIYPFLALLAAATFSGIERLNLGTPKITVAVLLLLMHIGDSLYSHPDYLAYFTPPVRGSEHLYLLDSNLDWGQDLARLADYVRAKKLPAILLTYEGDDHAAKFGINNLLLPPGHPDCCWVATGVNALKGIGPYIKFLEFREPDARVGKSIFVFRLAPQEVYSVKDASPN